MVIVLAEVAEPYVLHPRVVGTGEELGGLVIGEVAEGAGDPLLQELWVAPRAEHLSVVVRLQHDVGGTADILLDVLGRVPDICR